MTDSTSGWLYLLLRGELSLDRGVAGPKRSYQQRSVEFDQAAALFGDPALVIGSSCERSKCVTRLPAQRARDLHCGAQHSPSDCGYGWAVGPSYCSRWLRSA
jgi:hypothetical protein